jgi:two-component system chemotaxis response regulator CheY
MHEDTEDPRVTRSAETQQMSADVLVVDDDADVRWTVAEVLRSAGFSVAEAEDGEIARVMLSTGSYRVVLLDMRMPRRDGVSLIEAVGTVPPVIVHSAYSLDASDLERLGSRVVDYLHKPVSPQKLLRAVEAVLEAGD